MSETLVLPAGGTREEIYRAVFPQIEAIVSSCDDLIANLANVAAILKEAFGFHWVGFYRTTQPGLLTLGPFQGPLACVTIAFDRGVCGAAAKEQKTVLVPDVEAFPGHIACSSLSRSEIVVPLVFQGETRLVLDVDSDQLSGFDALDQSWLERVVAVLAKQHFSAAAD